MTCTIIIHLNQIPCADCLDTALITCSAKDDACLSLPFPSPRNPRSFLLMFIAVLIVQHLTRSMFIAVLILQHRTLFTVILFLTVFTVFVVYLSLSYLISCHTSICVSYLFYQCYLFLSLFVFSFVILLLYIYAKFPSFIYYFFILCIL